MSSQESKMLDALKNRLLTIKKANGYPFDVVKVVLSQGQIQFNIPASDCPQIEIIQLPEEYETKAGGLIEISSAFALRLVAPKHWDDHQMADFKSAVIRCIYANSFSATANAGISLADENGHGTIVFPRVRQCQTDYNLLQGNRIYALMFDFTALRQTYCF